MSDTRFRCATEAFDAYHRKDPNTETVNGQVYPAELLYAERMTDRLTAFAPDANEAVRLAARCQHIGRWEIARENYPMDRKGYLAWRNEEKRHHAHLAEEILSKCGYPSDTIDKVKSLLLKKQLHTDADAQLLEDVVCQVFVIYYLEDFAQKHDAEKLVDILRKTLKKMSDRGIEALNGLPVPPAIRPLVSRAMV